MLGVAECPVILPPFVDWLGVVVAEAVGSVEG